MLDLKGDAGVQSLAEREENSLPKIGRVNRGAPDCGSTQHT